MNNTYEKISNEATYKFVIYPPWYKKWWAYLGYGVVLFIFMSLLISIMFMGNLLTGIFVGAF